MLPPLALTLGAQWYALMWHTNDICRYADK
jgi:hypothetical protein